MLQLNNNFHQHTFKLFSGHLGFFGQELEDFDVACKRLMAKIRHVLPEGCPRTRIRATTRVSRQLECGALGETLGDESRTEMFGSTAFLALLRSLRSTHIPRDLV